MKWKRNLKLKRETFLSHYQKYNCEILREWSHYINLKIRMIQQQIHTPDINDVEELIAV